MSLTKSIFSALKFGRRKRNAAPPIATLPATPAAVVQTAAPDPPRPPRRCRVKPFDLWPRQQLAAELLARGWRRVDGFDDASGRRETWWKDRQTKTLRTAAIRERLVPACDAR